jgi:hypothetical protein
VKLLPAASRWNLQAYFDRIGLEREPASTPPP